MHTLLWYDLAMENKGVLEKAPQKEDAKAHIQLMMQECAVMGTNDFEIPALVRLIKRLDALDITPEEAMSEAEKIRYSKQEYR
jgi:hypothetical protein